MIIKGVVMAKNEVISNSQLTMLIFTFIISTATLFLPSFVIEYAGRDGWMSPFLALLVGIAIVLTVTKLGDIYPTFTPIEYSEKILGKWLGKVVGLLFILFYIRVTSLIVRQISTTINTNILLNSTQPTVTLMLFIVTAYAVKKGLESIARINVFILLMTGIAMFASLIFLINGGIHVYNITPVFSKGMMPIVRGSIPIIRWIGEIVSIAFIIPFIDNKKKVRKYSIIGVIWSIVTLSVFIILDVMLFGAKLSASFAYVTLEAIRMTNILNYVQRAEIVFLVPWMLSNFVKLSFFYYITVLVVARYFKMDDYKKLVLPVGTIIFSLSVASFENNIDLAELIGETLGVYFGIVQLGIPLILLIVKTLSDKIRGKCA